MAAVAVLSAMSAEGEKGVHPFFTRVNQTPQQVQELGTLNVPQVPGALKDSVEDEQGQDATKQPVRANSKRRKLKADARVESSKKQKTLSEVVNTKVTRDLSEGDNSNGDSTSPKDGSRAPSAKRQHTEESRVVTIDPSLENAPKDDVAVVTQAEKPVDGDELSKTTSLHSSLPLPQLPAASDDSGPVTDGQITASTDTPPKKMLRLKSNGKFSSPVSVNSQSDQEKSRAQPIKKRGRPRKSADNIQRLSLLVKFTYGTDAADRSRISEAISRILTGEERYSRLEVHRQKNQTPKKPKATHPFFLGKSKAVPPAPPNPSPRKTSAVTPGKLRMQTITNHPQPLDLSTNYSFGSGLLKDRSLFKHPGARDPPFPSKDQAHVRGLDGPLVRPSISSDDFQARYGRRKHKGLQLPFPGHESVVMRRFSSVCPDAEPPLRSDGFREPHPFLHIPERRLLCGDEIALRASHELSAPTDFGCGIEAPSSSQQSGRSAIQRLLKRVPASMRAFDGVRGESLAWTQRYAPQAAAEVLQPEKEMTILRDWLKSLTVQTVSSGITKDAKIITRQPKPKRKRRKRDDDLDDFLVDDDEEIHDMNELPDLDDDSQTAVGKPLRSIVQVSHGGTKLSNAVLLSGPHGCGKTAAAYAVAKELDFKVFEINSSERRSGKDVIERVGDMVENHLVKHRGTDSADLSSAEESSRVDEAFRQDLESGRQGKMNTFFRPETHSKPVLPKSSRPAQALQAVKEVLKKPSKEQQQSLILLEEVDILFRDDKDFWTIVLKLIVDSKRPFILTCNDEDIVPLQAISMHAILRFSPPPEDVAADYMLLVAAAEGHLLNRAAIRSLYRSKNFDLRSSLTQLDFWCQMGIGDPRGGLSWIYQRWPPGADTDAQGRTLRVVSDGTYTDSMGLLPASDELDAHYKMHWSWTEYGVDPAIALGWSDMDNAPVAQSSKAINATPKQNFTELKNYECLADELSNADICCARGLPETASVDTTAPELPDKAHGQYVEGLKLLQFDESTDHSHLSEEILISMTLSAFQNSRWSPSTDQLTPNQLLRYITATKPKRVEPPCLDRRTFACFDAIAVAEDTAAPAGTGMVQSAFDGPLALVACDLAPYVRSIVRHDRALGEQRDRIDQLTAEHDGGRRAKRARTTRAARSALEGGQRSTTRRERWFAKDLNYDAVLATGGGEQWRRSVLELLDEEGSRDGTGVASQSVTSTGDAE